MRAGSKGKLGAVGDRLGNLGDRDRYVLCDPQTSGGLLVAVAPDAAAEVEAMLAAANLPAAPIGQLSHSAGEPTRIRVTHGRVA